MKDSDIGLLIGGAVVLYLLMRNQQQVLPVQAALNSQALQTGAVLANTNTIGNALSQMTTDFSAAF